MGTLTPVAHCTCGVHATAGLVGALGALDPYARLGWRVRHRITGRVALWGNVVECAGGWRAERAYPSRLIIPARRLHEAPVPGLGRIATALERYGVPVEVADAGSRFGPAAVLEVVDSV